MKKFSKNFVVGTDVLINGQWCKITEIHETKQWIKVDSLAGSFQRNHVTSFKKAAK